MYVPVPDTGRESLTARYHPSYRATARRLPGAVVAVLRTAAVARSPLHYERGDMRRQYDWPRAVLTAGLTGLALAVAGRLALTGVLMTLFAPRAADLALLNAVLTLATGGGAALFAVARLVAAPRPATQTSLDRTFVGRRRRALRVAGSTAARAVGYAASAARLTRSVAPSPTRAGRATRPRRSVPGGRRSTFPGWGA
ncbi:hypothetical protein [Halomarina ordinaria]|uniref:Uncharacterized protein n=1 Tax=Halomarina ordinaria TaxID=3033939 RepID=A0ABD5UDU1_9EURY|nr:hypothetical protein [Halomarina sp. PSRA2]